MARVDYALPKTRQNGPDPTSSKKAPQDEQCFCHKFKEILLLTHIFGQNIISVKHVQVLKYFNPGQPTVLQRKCVFYYKFLSFWSLLNLGYSISYVYFTVWVYNNIADHMGVFFEGTDLYTLGFEIVGVFILTTLLQFFSRLHVKKLEKAVGQLQEVYLSFKSILELNSISAWNNGLDVFRKTKRNSKICIIHTLTSSLLYMALFLFLIFGETFSFQNDEFIRQNGSNNSSIVISDTKAYHNWHSNVFFLEKVAHTIVPFCFQSFACFFNLFVTAIREIFEGIGENVKKLVETPTLLPPSGNNFPLSSANGSFVITSASGCRTEIQRLSFALEKWRILYEATRKAVDKTSNYFGPGLVALCAIGILSMTAGVYSMILHQSKLSVKVGSEDKKLVKKYMYCLWGFHLYFALANLITVLYSGQLLLDSAKLPEKILRNIQHTGMDDELKYQITLFISTASQPTAVTACKIFTIRMSFWAGAVTQLITYILVLVQFRLSFSSNQIELETERFRK